jgi:uncharacterized protein
MTTGRRGMRRREFLETAVAGAGLAALGCARERKKGASTASRMRYRPLGATGLQVSEITFGCHGVDNPPLLPAALDAGINTFFTSGEYLDGREEEALGRVIGTLGSGRDRVVVVTGNVVPHDASRRRILDSIDSSLRRLRTDHIDVYGALQVSSPEELRIDAFHEAIGEAKRAGKILHLGLSGHCGGMQACLNAAIDDGRYEVFLTKHDFVSYPDQAEILRRAAERGIGTIVFKTNAGARNDEVRDLEATGLSLRQASVKWALTNPDVASVAVTILNFDRLEECVACSGSPPTRAEEELLARYRDAVREKYCRFCRRCEGRCPRGVAVADVNRFAMYGAQYGLMEDAARRYRALAPGRSAAACASCEGSCAAACPFRRRVREELVEAHALLGGERT